MEIIVLAVVLMVFIGISYIMVEIMEARIPIEEDKYYVHYSNPDIKFIEMFRNDTTIYLLQTRDNIRIDLSLSMFERDFKRDV